MRSAFGLTLMLVGIALEWVALHGYDAPDPGFKGLLEGIYRGIQDATSGG